MCHTHNYFLLVKWDHLWSKAIPDSIRDRGRLRTIKYTGANGRNAYPYTTKMSPDSPFGIIFKFWEDASFRNHSPRRSVGKWIIHFLFKAYISDFSSFTYSSYGTMMWNIAPFPYQIYLRPNNTMLNVILYKVFWPFSGKLTPSPPLRKNKDLWLRHVAVIKHFQIYPWVYARV